MQLRSRLLVTIAAAVLTSSLVTNSSQAVQSTPPRLLVSPLVRAVDTDRSQLWREFWSDWDEYGIYPPPVPVKLPGNGQCSQAEFRSKAKTKILNSVAPLYTPISRVLNESGVVVVDVAIDRAGRVCYASVRKSSGFARLDRAALQAVVLLEFQPPVLPDGTIGEAMAGLPLNFKLVP